MGNPVYPLCLSFTLFAGFEGLEGVNVPLDVDEDTITNINEKVGPWAGFEGLEGVNVPLIDVDEDTVTNINEKVGLSRF